MLELAIINGPNLNLLGKREPEVYGHASFEDFLEQIKKDFEIRLERYKGKSNKNKNYLREDIIDIDEIYNVDEGNGSCNICHK
jgi:3-dehydroquinate dehydratase